jgi:hypothetical protein
MSKAISRCRIQAAANDPRPLLVTVATKPTSGGVTWALPITARTTQEALAWAAGFFELLGSSLPTVGAASPAFTVTPANSNHPADVAAPANPPPSGDLLQCVERRLSPPISWTWRAVSVPYSSF